MGSKNLKAIDRNAFSEMKKEYYQLEQWDAKAGLPKLVTPDFGFHRK